MSTKLVGGTGDVKPADDAAVEVANAVRSEVEQKLNKQLPEFTAVSYKTQLVNGTNFFIKVKVGESEHVHVRAHKTFQGEITLSAVQENKQAEEEIAYFD